MDKNSNSLNWFEIPVTDLSRAKKFYQDVFMVELADMPEMMGMKMSGFPAEMGNGKANGALAESPMHTPSAEGVVIYLNANPEIQPVIDRVEAAGGKVVMPATEISPEIGKMAFIIDSEGNKIGIHAQA
jgi:predicted enzyme related to lactoylglutathione lyase